jgi:outer membrane protein assembly factor BamB
MKRSNIFAQGKAGRLGSILLAAAGSATLAAGADWPQFMGPNGDGTSVEKGLLRAWPADGPKVLWTVAVGPGYGGAAIRDEKVYALDRVGRQKDVLRCLDLGSGKEEWTFSYDAGGEINHDGSRSTPAVTARNVYTIGPFGQFHCLDGTAHQVVWKKNLRTDSPRISLYHNDDLFTPQMLEACYSGGRADQLSIVRGVSQMPHNAVGK